MSNNKKNFLIDITILINFIVVIFAADSWLWVHVGAGLTLLTLLIFHINRHWWWFKALYRTGRVKSEKVPRNRIINVGLLTISALTILSGAALAYAASGIPVIGSPSGQASQLLVSYHNWKILHEVGARLVLALGVWHFAVHWNWFVSIARSYFKKESCEKQKQV